MLCRFISSPDKHHSKFLKANFLYWITILFSATCMSGMLMDLMDFDHFSALVLTCSWLWHPPHWLVLYAVSRVPVMTNFSSYMYTVISFNDGITYTNRGHKKPYIYKVILLYSKLFGAGTVACKITTHHHMLCFYNIKTHLANEMAM